VQICSRNGRDGSGPSYLGTAPIPTCVMYGTLLERVAHTSKTCEPCECVVLEMVCVINCSILTVYRINATSFPNKCSQQTSSLIVISNRTSPHPGALHKQRNVSIAKHTSDAPSSSFYHHALIPTKIITDISPQLHLATAILRSSVKVLHTHAKFCCSNANLSPQAGLSLRLTSATSTITGINFAFPIIRTPQF
jgi:hypothetical protein